MRSLTEQLTQYASYHRDKRNIITHFVGIPLIVVAVATLLARPELNIMGIALTPALLVVVAASTYYIKLDLRFGMAMVAALIISLWIGNALAALSTELWLLSGIGLFVVGWIIQFVGHVYERRKPAFIDDIMGLAIGPLFVAAEVAFILGLRKELQDAIEGVTGPAVIKEATTSS
ncbi:Mpo1 family 2-hydroxy fatty acid dioxygenase [Ketobacter alkanivorans]|uniref:DUF962 domain-containing protein n=1 Tax=Ketobacter alkanivorans TaxID=1917421 RepID=A0A2K9LNL2_9GAMM|nr:Mpo1-like protein [Ketobacter alkanivorans]AUM13959.1 hypothetical protein Kalk_16660 [Ketobacter alkanivorans]